MAEFNPFQDVKYTEDVDWEKEVETEGYTEPDPDDEPDVVSELEKMIEKQGPPGPPPRKGLVWKPQTSRWIKPEEAKKDVRILSHAKKDIWSGKKTWTMTLKEKLNVMDDWVEKQEGHLQSFGASKTEASHIVETMRQWAIGNLGELDDLVAGWKAGDPVKRGLVQAQYDYTQHILKSRYPKGTVTLYRGVNTKENLCREGGKARLEGSGASSWTTKSEIAIRYDQAVKVEVPIEKVFATYHSWRTSLFAEHEREFIVIDADTLLPQAVCRGKRGG